MEMKVVIPAEVESSDEVVAVITYLEGAQTGPLVIRGAVSGTKKVPMEVTTSEPRVLTSRP